MFFKKTRYTKIKPRTQKIEIPGSLCTACPKCSELILEVDLTKNLKVCPVCDYHFKLTALDRIGFSVDEGTFVEEDRDLTTSDPLKFTDSKSYPKRIKAAQAKTGMKEGILCGTAEIDRVPVNIGVMDFHFIGGSMGSVVGEKVTRLIERALDNKAPIVLYICSGGARMQEAIISLMQMAKTCGALALLDEQGIPFITVLTNPSMAGVMASYGSLGDITIAEPDAIIGFAGPRVIKQTINEVLPKGFQTSEFLLQHGFIDMVVHRKAMRTTLSKLLRIVRRVEQ